MGKKGRTGKKAWTRINTQDVDDFREQSTREERQGLVVEGVPDIDLWFEDKGGEADVAAAVAAGVLPRNRKQAARVKVLRSAAILTAPQGAKPVGAVPTAKPKGSVLAQQQRAKEAAAAARAAAKPGPKRSAKQAAIGGGSGQAGDVRDLWDAPAAPGEEWTDGLLLENKRRKTTAAPSAQRALATSRGGGSATAVRERRGAAVPAVEIDPSGCSYNPDAGLHQEAVAAAVAVETRKLLDRDLAPVAPPRTVDWDPETDELALLQTIEGPADEDEEDETAGGEGDAEGEGAAAARRRAEVARKTRKDRNRDARRRAAEEAAEASRKAKAQRRELAELGRIQSELAEQQEEQAAARLRRKLDREERLAGEPPKLSRHKFQPMPLQVLTSDELAGSLRRLKPTAMLAKDRYKSLQKRALIEPRRRIEQRKQGKRVSYIQGERAERAQEAQAELAQLRAAKKAAAKAAKAAKAATPAQ